MEQMKSGIASILMIILAVILVGWSCSIQVSAETLVSYDGNTLIEQAKNLNGKTLIYEGEIVGDMMQRQDHFWINVQNNGTSIGIWLTSEQRAIIKVAGQYAIKGDQVRIIGQFNQACSEHGGDLDIHASSIEILQGGEIVVQKLNIVKFIVAGILLLLAVSSLSVVISRQFRTKRKIVK